MRPSLQMLNLSKHPNSSSSSIDVVESPSGSPRTSSVGPIVGEIPTDLAGYSERASQIRSERRRQKRAGLRLTARVRPAELKYGDRHEVLATLNASRESFYFTTASERYRPGMRLRVTFPFNSAHDSAAISEDDGQVMRTERLPSNLIGVAVQLRGPAHMARAAAASAKPPVSGGMTAERRTNARHPFSAEAVVFDPQSNIRLQARCSDLSLEGCYVDTMNAFPQGTITRLELRTADKNAEFLARVNSSHIGMGMGLSFQDLTPEQSSVLADWLNDKPEGRPSVIALSEPAKQDETIARTPARATEQTPDQTLDRTLAISMVRQMLSKGILTKADLSDILFGVI